MRYDASAWFTDAQPIDSQRWGTPRIEIYEGATADPALAFAWSAHGTGTRNWATGDPGTAYMCRVASDSVAFSTWPSSAGEDSTLFQVTPTSTSTSSGTGQLNLTAAPDYETPTDSGGDNLYKVRVSSGHNLNAISGEGQRTGCNGSALELTVMVTAGHAYRRLPDGVRRRGGDQQLRLAFPLSDEKVTLTRHAIGQYSFRQLALVERLPTPDAARMAFRRALKRLSVVMPDA